MCPLSPPTSPSIPAVFIGITRKTALDSSINLLSGTPYYVAAVLDTTKAPQEYRFTPQNLGTVLYALHPRPRILVTGTALDETVASIERVWKEHVERLEGGESCWVAVRCRDFSCCWGEGNGKGG